MKLKSKSGLFGAILFVFIVLTYHSYNYYQLYCYGALVKGKLVCFRPSGRYNVRCYEYVVDSSKYNGCVGSEKQSVLGESYYVVYSKKKPYISMLIYDVDVKDSTFDEKKMSLASVLRYASHSCGWDCSCY